MGNATAVCCDASKSADIVFDQNQNSNDNASDVRANESKLPEDVAEGSSESSTDVLYRSLCSKEGISLFIILTSGDVIPCTLAYNPDPQEPKFIVTAFNKHRPVFLDQIKELFVGSQLIQVKTSAKISNDPTCLGIVLNIQNCIPLKFNNEQQRADFEILFKKLKDTRQKVLNAQGDDHHQPQLVL
eukprot:GDKJ01004520.1.p1 GENE.GDKJ01004520.1~~GDKJ01004520.1.p1  ORF type:complete len:195 (-),score=39.17 GDKJ01004520.1:506-1063(-)